MSFFYQSKKIHKCVLVSERFEDTCFRSHSFPLVEDRIYSNAYSGFLWIKPLNFAKNQPIVYLVLKLLFLYPLELNLIDYSKISLNLGLLTIQKEHCHLQQDCKNKKNLESTQSQRFLKHGLNKSLPSLIEALFYHSRPQLSHIHLHKKLHQCLLCTKWGLIGSFWPNFWDTFHKKETSFSFEEDFENYLPKSILWNNHLLN